MAKWIQRHDNQRAIQLDLQDEADEREDQSSGDESEGQRDDAEVLPRLLNRGHRTSLAELRVGRLADVAHIPTCEDVLREAIGGEKIRVHGSAKLHNGQKIRAGRFHDRDIRSSVDAQIRGESVHGQLLLLWTGKAGARALLRLFKNDKDDQTRHPHLKLTKLQPLRLRRKFAAVPLSAVSELAHIVPDWSSGREETYLLNPYIKLSNLVA